MPSRAPTLSVEPFHLFRYLDEQAFRFNNRKMTDAVRFALALKGVLDKRLTYTALTGSELPQIAKRASPNYREVRGVPADDPAGTMERFTAGLRKVLTAPRLRRQRRIKTRKHR